MQGYTALLREALEQLNTRPTHLWVQAGVGGLAAAASTHLSCVWGEERPTLVIVEPRRAACLYGSAAATADDVSVARRSGNRGPRKRWRGARWPHDAHRQPRCARGSWPGGRRNLRERGMLLRKLSRLHQARACSAFWSVRRYSVIWAIASDHGIGSSSCRVLYARRAVLPA